MSSWTNPDNIAIPDSYLRIGHVTRAHGIRGSVVVKFYSDSPEQFGQGLSVRMHPSETPLVLATMQPVRDGWLVSFEGVADRNGAEVLRGQQLLIEQAERRSLDDDEFWPADLVGMKVEDPDGLVLGTVVDVHLGEAQDRLEIEHEGARALVPFVADLVPEVRLVDQTVVVRPLPGLLVQSSLEEE